MIIQFLLRRKSCRTLITVMRDWWSKAPLTNLARLTLPTLRPLLSISSLRFILRKKFMSTSWRHLFFFFWFLNLLIGRDSILFTLSGGKSASIIFRTCYIFLVAGIFFNGISIAMHWHSRSTGSGIPAFVSAHPSLELSCNPWQGLIDCIRPLCLYLRLFFFEFILFYILLCDPINSFILMFWSLFTFKFSISRWTGGEVMNIRELGRIFIRSVLHSWSIIQSCIHCIFIFHFHTLRLHSSNAY